MFADRILSFGAAQAQAYAVLLARARLQGKAITPADGYIAATAASAVAIAARVRQQQAG